PFSKATCQLLLLKIHDPDQVWHGVCNHLLLAWLVNERELIRPDSDLGKKVPADPVDLRHGQHGFEPDREHAPQPLLELLRIDALEHLILTNHPARIDDLR